MMKKYFSDLRKLKERLETTTVPSATEINEDKVKAKRKGSSEDCQGSLSAYGALIQLEELRGEIVRLTEKIDSMRVTSPPGPVSEPDGQREPMHARGEPERRSEFRPDDRRESESRAEARRGKARARDRFDSVDGEEPLSRGVGGVGPLGMESGGISPLMGRGMGSGMMGGMSPMLMGGGMGMMGGMSPMSMGGGIGMMGGMSPMSMGGGMGMMGGMSPMLMGRGMGMMGGMSPMLMGGGMGMMGGMSPMLMGRGMGMRMF
jgi:hypothetical protein